MKRTCLYEKHVALGALISPFGGFEMPIQYAGINPNTWLYARRWASLTSRTWAR